MICPAFTMTVCFAPTFPLTVPLTEASSIRGSDSIAMMLTVGRTNRFVFFFIIFPLVFKNFLSVHDVDATLNGADALTVQIIDPVLIADSLPYIADTSLLTDAEAIELTPSP